MVLLRDKRNRAMKRRIRFIMGKYHREAAGPSKPLWRIASMIGTERKSRAVAIPKQRKAGKRAPCHTKMSLSGLSTWTRNPSRVPIASN
jgi:hypothetical protein